MKKSLIVVSLILVCISGGCCASKLEGSRQRGDNAKLVRLAQTQYERGDLNGAAKTLLDCLGADPHNEPARYYLNLLREAEFQKSLNRRDPGARYWYPTIPPRRFGSEPSAPGNAGLRPAVPSGSLPRRA